MSKKFVITLVVAVAVLGVIIGYPKLTGKKEELNIGQPSSPKLTLDILKNGVYTWNLITEGKPFKFTDGIFYFPPLPGESQEDYFVKIDGDHIAFGDLNNDGQEDAAVILVSRAGGTGTHREVAIVLNQNGNGNNVASQYLGDRTTIHSLTVETPGVIKVDMTPWEGGSGTRRIAIYRYTDFSDTR